MSDRSKRGGRGDREGSGNEEIQPLGFGEDYEYTTPRDEPTQEYEDWNDPEGEDFQPDLFEPEPDPGLVRSFLSYIYAGSLLTFSAIVFFAIGYGWPFLQDQVDQLPGIEIVNDYRPNLGSQLYDSRGEPVAEFFGERDLKEKRLRLVRYEEIPDYLTKALVATEDQQFWRHTGLNPFRIGRAALHNFQTGSRHGGSTLTQQLAKDLFTDWAPTLERKMVEALYAIKIEKELTKEEILTVFLNQVDFGHGTRGLLSAAEHYFGKHPKDLDLAESATLVGLLKANTRYSPITNPDKSKARRGVVLRLMLDCEFITEEEYEQAAEEELVLKSESSRGVPQLDKYPFWTSFVRDKLLTQGSGFQTLPLTSDLAQIDEADLYTNGFKIQTTLDPKLQEWGEEALRKALVEQETIYRKNRPGWGLPDESKPRFSDTLRPNANLLGKITGFEEPRWLTVQLVEVAGKPVVAVPHPGRKDWRDRFGVLSPPYYVPVEAYERETEVSPEEQDLVDRGLVTKQKLRFELENQYDDQHAEGALVCLEVGTGRILAWVGGYDWYSELPASRRNRVIEPLQPGSSFKPLVYAAAFEKGYTPNTRVSNAPYTKYLSNGQVWSPKNYYEDMIGGVYPVRKILIKSLNIPTVRVFESIIGGSYVHEPFYGKPTLEIAKRFGIRSLVPKELSVSLGTAEITPLEMATAYSVFANDGLLIEPYAIESIQSRDGDRVYAHVPRGNENAYSSLNSFLMTDILTGVLRDPAGTGYRHLAEKPFPYPIAGKTGTTNNYFDAWFLGYSKNLVTALWIGHDRWTSLGSKRSGGTVALPPWLEFMEKAIPYHFETHLGVAREKVEAASKAPSIAASPLDFERPDTGLRRVEVCTWSNLKPNAYCPKTTTMWVREGEEPRGVCQDHGIRYVEAPVMAPVERFPSQAPRYDPGSPRRIRRLEPIGVGAPPAQGSEPAPLPDAPGPSGVDPESIPPQVPQLRIENIRDLDFNEPPPVYDLDSSVEPAVPRPLPNPLGNG